MYLSDSSRAKSKTTVQPIKETQHSDSDSDGLDLAKGIRAHRASQNKKANGVNPDETKTEEKANQQDVKSRPKRGFQPPAPLPKPISEKNSSASNGKLTKTKATSALEPISQNTSDLSHEREKDVTPSKAISLKTSKTPFDENDMIKIKEEKMAKTQIKPATRTKSSRSQVKAANTQKKKENLDDLSGDDADSIVELVDRKETAARTNKVSKSDARNPKGTKLNSSDVATRTGGSRVTRSTKAPFPKADDVEARQVEQVERAMEESTQDELISTPPASRKRDKRVTKASIDADRAVQQLGEAEGSEETQFSNRRRGLRADVDAINEKGEESFPGYVQPWQEELGIDQNVGHSMIEVSGHFSGHC